MGAHSKTVNPAAGFDYRPRVADAELEARLAATGAVALRRGTRECAAQVPVSHALRAVAGRDSFGVRLITRKRSGC